MTAGYIAGGEVTCGVCYTNFVKPQEVLGEGNVMVLQFVCWRGHLFELYITQNAEAERVTMIWGAGRRGTG